MKKAHSTIFGLFLLLLLACSTEGDKRFCCFDGKTSITSEKVGERKVKNKSLVLIANLGLFTFYRGV